jgi:predicted ester cyclase
MADNKETVRRMFDEVVNLGKLELIDELWDPDFQSETAQGTLDLDAFKQFVAGWRAGFADLHCEVADLLAEGDRVAWSVRATGTHSGDFMGLPATGRSVDFDSLNICQFRGGRAYRHKVLMDLPKLMAQLGQVPGT